MIDGFFSGLADLVFFSTIKGYLDHEAGYFLGQILGNAYTLIGGILITIITIWVVTKGYLIMSGQSGESLMGFILSAGKIVLIISAATALGAGGGTLYSALNKDIPEAITYVVTGENGDPYSNIDKNLTLMQAGLGAMKAIDTGDNAAVESERTQALWMSGAGTAGPAIVAGTMMLINKFGMALFVGLGPIFILCLLFKQTAPMFHGWVKFGLGLMLSMAVLSFMSEISMRMVGALATASFTQDLFGLGNPGFTSAAMQQGGLGLILTALLITVPNMVVGFIGTQASGFTGVSALGNFGSHSTPAAGGMGGASVMGGGVTGGNMNTQGSTSETSSTTSHGGRSTQGFNASASSGGTDYSVMRPAGTSTMGLARQTEVSPLSASYGNGAAGQNGGGVASGIGDDSASINAMRNPSASSTTGQSQSGLPQGRQNPARL